MGARGLIVLAAACGAPQAPASPQVRSLPERVTADFEKAVLSNKDAYVALFDFAAVGEFEILLHRRDLIAGWPALTDAQHAQYVAEDGTPFPEARERRNVGNFYPILAQRTVGTGGCTAAEPRSEYGRLLGQPIDALPECQSPHGLRYRWAPPMRSSAIVVALAACVAPPVPVSPIAPAPDRYQRAAAQDPAIRAAAAGELVADPSLQAGRMLLVLEQRDVDPRVRAAAAQAIAERRDPTLDDALEHSAMADPDPAVRTAAQAAHERLWPWAKQPRSAAGLSLLCPGCGQIYLHEQAEGAALLGTTAALIASGVLLTRGHSVTLDGASDSARAPIGLSLLLAGQNTWFYAIFDAYRDARVLRGDAGYKHPITRETLPELASAPFRPSVLARPWVWAGVPIALGVGLAMTYLANGGSLGGNPSIFDVKDVNFLGHHLSRGAGFAAGTGYFAALFDPVGVGEESLFRGLLQTELEERLGTYGGLALASALFGAAHLANFGHDPKQALYAVPTIAVLGSSLGLAYIHTGHKLETSVAMHFWYDFLLSTAAFAADPAHQPFVVQYASTM